MNVAVTVSLALVSNIELTSTFYKIHWGFNDGRCDEKPNVESHGEKKEVTLIPYGCTNLRITEFPFI